MAITLIPYGLLEDGKYGIKLSDDASGVPIVAAIEVLDTLPSAADPDNFAGRTVFAKDAQLPYVFLNDTIAWFPLEGIPAEVGAVGGNPPTVPVPPDGSLFYDTDTEVSFVWDGATWQAMGGRFAARYVEQYTPSSTGFAGPGGDQFSLGTTPVYSEFVEVYLDGVRQNRLAGDYSVIGSSIFFPAPVPIGVRVSTRTLESTVLEDPAILQNAQCIRDIYDNQAAGITDFDIGAAGVDPSCTMVFQNGSFLVGGGIDYTVSSANTTITNIIKTAVTTAQVTTLFAHGAAPGDVVTITGCDQPEFNGTFSIGLIISPSVFEIPVAITAPASCTGALVSYNPPMVNDEIILNSGTTLGDDITIMTFQRIIVAPAVGEANTASNLGVGVGLFSTKTSIDLRFKSLTGGSGVLVTDSGGGTVTISADALQTYESRVGINTSVYNLGTTDSYIGVRDTSSVVTIDVSTVPGGTSGSGRRLVVQDESGGAGTNNIQIAHAGAQFGGAASPLIINVGYGSVTIVYDGTNWHIVSKTF
jgi:hypothetical protein